MIYFRDMSDTETVDLDTDNEKAMQSKKRKRMCTYRREWESTYNFLKNVDGNVHKAFCEICTKSFGISHGGLNDVKRHIAISEHRRGENTRKSNQTLQMFLKRDILTTDEEKVLASELVKVYHGVKHNIS